MYNQIEKELKILVTKEEYEKIVKSYEFTNPWSQTNTYYDTSDGYVKSLNGACRIRTIGEKKIFTLKIRISADSHIELEKEVNTNTMAEITDEEVLGWLNKYEIPASELQPKMSFTTNRRLCDLEKAELCADETIFDSHIDYEIEYEYKKPHDGIPAFNELLSVIGKEYEKNCPSKIARA
ncbi:MAG: CYTH domain-containing protein [Firmicutes bacterium]|nr:CYTH domain-containing protein [Bacillota bacterium]